MYMHIPPAAANPGQAGRANGHKNRTCIDQQGVRPGCKCFVQHQASFVRPEFHNAGVTDLRCLGFTVGLFAGMNFTHGSAIAHAAAYKWLSNDELLFNVSPRAV
jgi:hypothetical protein